jgi:hypothetical protein
MRRSIGAVDGASHAYPYFVHSKGGGSRVIISTVGGGVFICPFLSAIKGSLIILISETLKIALSIKP